MRTLAFASASWIIHKANSWESFRKARVACSGAAIYPRTVKSGIFVAEPGSVWPSQAAIPQWSASRPRGGTRRLEGRLSRVDRPDHRTVGSPAEGPHGCEGNSDG